MAWCFSRASVAKVMSAHPCVFSFLLVNGQGCVIHNYEIVCHVLLIKEMEECGLDLVCFS